MKAWYYDDGSDVIPVKVLQWIVKQDKIFAIILYDIGGGPELDDVPLETIHVTKRQAQEKAGT